MFTHCQDVAVQSYPTYVRFYVEARIANKVMLKSFAGSWKEYFGSQGLYSMLFINIGNWLKF